MTQFFNSDGNVAGNVLSGREGRSTRRLLYSDVIEHLTMLAQGYGVGVPLDAIKAVVANAYDELVQAWEWSYLSGVIPLLFPASLYAGAASCDSSTGLVTLRGSKWPSWAMDGALIVRGETYRANEVLSESVARIEPPYPSFDNESFLFGMAAQELPEDFLSTEGPVNSEIYTHSTPWEIFSLYRNAPCQGTIRRWTISGGDDGGMDFLVYPMADRATTIELPFRRRARELLISGYSAPNYAGTVTLAGGTITGVGTAFHPRMIGSVLRLSRSINVPTGLSGKEPFLSEHRILGIVSATQLTVENSSEITAASVGYRVSDPLDISRSMQDAMLRLAEKHFAVGRNFKDKASFASLYEGALKRAKSADKPITERRIAGSGITRAKPRLRDLL